MKYKLLFCEKGWWKQVMASNNYNDIRETASQIDDNTEWMIVEVKRYHSGAAEETNMSEDDIFEL